ncbi:malonyl-ACP O-methyltransferase BioC [Paenibacillus sp. CGMCC 1.16610]|uniref:Malonyl-[acyl-carrier protein] O-methyltransferase n=1 Tax=Paenibacillus anseongense TaxID=2682845 RepID=A0ABW9U867_9BACL|nr:MULTISPECIES: malonyl-ACP O-methyltransferase BioC [Paenibacillus]MBA2940351.1 malonyl-ACP O-methyltransferase BioC [Paenibacillus sp. CGMCC 1.16610]MVQ35528.1 malonyl-ACP O-methyltransferase BioC [Paenibacillus anseongense]
MNSSMEIERQFNRSSAGSYDEHANVQKMMAEQLAAALKESARESTSTRVGSILEIGCGTGIVTSGLVEKYPKASITALDIAPGMLQAAEQRVRGSQPAVRDIRFIHGDVEKWSAAASLASFDLIVSGACFQWLQNPKQTLQHLRRLLRPGGLLAFTTFGPATFYELHESFREVYRQYGQQPQRHGLTFQSGAGWRDMLVDSGFTHTNIQEERLLHVETYPTPKNFLHTVKAMGASTSEAAVTPGIGRRRLFVDMYKTYETKFSVLGGVSATYELLMMQARVPYKDRDSDKF